MVHALKTEPKHYAAQKAMIKPFEVRKNDRDFQIGDVLALNEWENGEYTGKALLREITYILDDSKYCKEGFAILGVIPLGAIPLTHSPMFTDAPKELTRKAQKTEEST